MLTDVLEDYVNIIIVTFAETARIHFPLSGPSSVFVLDSKEARQEAANSLLNVTTDQYTCIGDM